MWLFPVLIIFWATLLAAFKLARGRWRRWRFEQPARYLTEIEGVAYYRRLSTTQFESLMMQVFKAGGYTILDDPFLGRSKEQGYVWKAGKKAVVVHRPDTPLTSEELVEIFKQQRKVRAERALVFSPFPEAPAVQLPGVEVLSGKKLIQWFSGLENVAPPLGNRASAERCLCEAPMRERVNRAGQLLLVCSRYPDCRMMRAAVLPERAA